MKRSAQVRLLLLGTFVVGASTGCAPEVVNDPEPRVTAESFYPNDHYIAGAGYYHAPFRAFFPYRYNHYDDATKRYYFGGQWAAQPHESVINISAPTPEAAALAESARPAIQRGGFGRTGGSSHVWS